MNTPEIDLRKAAPEDRVGDVTQTAGADNPGPTDLSFLGPSQRPNSLGRLGHHDVIEILGRGGFGVVFRAFDEHLQRVVAIKVLTPEMAATSPARKRFLREARSAAQVRHENVVQLYAIEEHPLPYLVMEHVPGETLQQRLDRIGPLDPAEVVSIGRQMASALAAAHAAGIIHRDVKPANVLFQAGTRPMIKVTDFGLARAADDASITQSGVVAGTPLYMSPEQARGEKLDHRTDLFSLGSVLYAITSGRPPFRAENTLAVLKRVAEDEPRPIQEIIPETPEWLCRVIAKLMAKDAAARYQTAAEVVAALESEQAPPLPLAHRPARRRGLLIMGGLLAAAIFVGTGIYALTRPGVGPDPSDPGTLNASPRAPEQTPGIGRGGFPLGGGNRTRPQFSRDGKLVAVPAGSNVILFDVLKGEALRALASPTGDVRGIGISPDGRRLAAFCRGPGKVRTWDIPSDKILFTSDADDSIDFEPVFSPDGKWLVIAENQPFSRLRVLEASTGMEVKSIPTTTWYSGRFDRTGARFAATFRNPAGVAAQHPDQEKVTIWDTAAWREVGTLNRPPALDPGEYGEGMVQFSPGGKYLAACGSTGVAVWNAETLGLEATVDNSCFWFDFLADDKAILVQTTSGFQSIHEFAWFDISTAQNKGRFWVEGPRDYLYPAIDSTREYLFVAPYQSGLRLRIFQVRTGQELPPGGTSAPSHGP